jgi:hypothetical protein
MADVTPPAAPDIGRNIIQSHGERPIIKTAPDFIVFWENSPYVINQYVGDPFTVVNLNDFVISASGGVDIDSLIPSASVSLSVPNHLKYLFFAPGGNRILQTMADVKIFGKGYFLSEHGESIYYRTFWGLASSITYTDNGSTLDIEISCSGVLRTLELVQTNIQPAAMTTTNASGQVNGFVSRWPHTDPYRQIAIALVEDARLDSLSRNVVWNGGALTPDQKKALKLNFVAKWSKSLASISKATRIFPLTDEDIQKVLTIPSPQSFNIEFPQEANKRVTRDSEVALFKQQQEFELSRIHNWHPDAAIGNVQLVQSRIVSKLERIRQMVEIIGYEAYQDLDGNIIVKPPLYNLDCLDTSDSEALSENNPFIIHLDEIETEQETEDEHAIQCTRIQVHGNVSSYIDMPPEIVKGFASYTDVKLMKKFGLREDGIRKVAFLGTDPKSNFAYAVSEMAKLNRQYRTYQCTIPFRPELKLGFTAYFPHLDMYGYIRAINWSYGVGGSASMTVHCDQIRRRVMYEVKVENGGTVSFKFQSVPFLVHKLMKPPDPGEAKAFPTSEIGTPATIRPTADQLLSSDHYKVLSLQTADLRNHYQTSPDTPSLSWNVIDAKDDAFFGADNSDPKDQSKDKAVVCDANYLEHVRETQPYTNCKGYEVISPMPWGRARSLKAALIAFTKSDEQYARETEVLRGGTVASKVAAFLYGASGGISVKGQDLEKSLSSLDGLLEGVTSAISSNDTFFILRYLPNEAGSPGPTFDNTPASNADTAKQQAEERARQSVAAGNNVGGNAI